MRVERTASTYVITVDEPSYVAALDVLDPQAQEVDRVLRDMVGKSQVALSKQREERYGQLSREDQAAVDAILARATPPAPQPVRTRRTV